MNKVFRRMFSWRFRLQWKLTISYTLVTVSVMSIIWLVLVVAGNSIVYNFPQITLAMADALNGAARELVPALQVSPPDTTAMEGWLRRTFNNSTVILNIPDEDSERAGRYPFSYSQMASASSVLVILDNQGRVLVSNHEEQFPAGEPLPATYDPTARALVQSALAGETGINHLLARESGKQIAAAPILTDHGDLLGVVLLSLQQPSVFEMIWISLLSSLTVILYLGLLATIMGALFGALTSRGYARRLKNATQATAAWGQGDFSPRIVDNDADEIGQLARDLNRMAGQIQSLMRTRQDLAAMNERNRLARDLHDSVKQQVFATSMNLAAAKALWERNPAEAFKRLEIAAELSRQSQKELTVLIQTLRPTQLDEQGLSEALLEAAKLLERQNNIHTVCHLPEEMEPLPAEVEQALFRVAQEALANAARHSSATEVTLTLNQSPTLVELEILDNGAGFDPTRPSRGLGLRSMLERIQSLGGTLTITSHPGATCVIAKVPLVSAHES